MSHCILNCIFPFKVCVLILYCGPDGPAPFSCLGPAEVGEGKGNGRQGPKGLSPGMELFAESYFAHFLSQQGQP